jgi:hypothetical protein
MVIVKNVLMTWSWKRSERRSLELAFVVIKNSYPMDRVIDVVTYVSARIMGILINTVSPLKQAKYGF